MTELSLDGARWKTPNDLYDDFFRAVGAPTWHGRNFNALIDSIETGQINAVEVPYCIVIKNYNLVGPDAVEMTRDFVNLIGKIATRGCPVEIRTESTTATPPAHE